MTVGRQFRTIGRTVTETDIINFVSCTGLTEVFFINREAIEKESAFGRRFAPAALCYCFSEALIAQATLQYTGLAMLHLELDIKGRSSRVKPFTRSARWSRPGSAARIHRAAS
jgi:acyl dehydratase